MDTLRRLLPTVALSGVVQVLRLGGRLFMRLVGTVMAATLMTFIGLEVSIKGGFRAVLLPPGEPNTARDRETIELYHLDDNVVVRYLYWLGDAVRGDFGYSAVSGQPVTDILVHRIPISLQLMLVGVTVAILIAVPLALLAVAWRNNIGGKILNFFFGLSQGIPVYVSPLFLIALFAVQLQWLPASGWIRISDSLSGNLKNSILPLTALVLAEVGIIAKIVTADVNRVLATDYVVAAIGKGLSYPYVLFRHALRPASLGLLNIVGLNIGALLSGALVIELIFGIGALGQVLFEATISRDLPMLLGLTTYGVVVHKTLSTLVDAVVLMVDPRIRRGI